MRKEIVYISFGMNIIVVAAIVVAVVSAFHSRPHPPVNVNAFFVHGTTLSREPDGRRTIRGTVENRGQSVTDLRLAYCVYGTDGSPMAMCYAQLGALEHGKSTAFEYPVSNDTEGYSFGGFVTESETFMR